MGPDQAAAESWLVDFFHCSMKEYFVVAGCHELGHNKISPPHNIAADSFLGGAGELESRSPRVISTHESPALARVFASGTAWRASLI